MNYLENRPTAVFDSECFHGYWSIAFKCVNTGRSRLFEMFEGHPLDRAGIAKILRKWRIVGFNSIKYDLPMLMLAMTPTATNAALKRASDELINTGVPHWKWMERNDLEVPAFIDHIDLMQVNPGASTMPSLKLCGGRLHSRRLQDLPFEVDRVISAQDREVLRSYLGNDLDTTIDMYRELSAALNFRAAISQRYGMDMRSKSDAQMAEAMIKKDAEVHVGRIYKPDVVPKIFNYTPPEWVQFQTPQLQQTLEDIKCVQFVVDNRGIVEMPKYLLDKKITMGTGVYRMGIGGLHSSEESITHYSDEAGELRDNDVASMYPNIILSTGLVPPAFGDVFTTIYRGILKGRLANKAKAAALKKVMKDATGAELERLKREYNEVDTIQQGQKISLNGAYGKLGSAYSVLYAPELMIQVTITGQLFLLMCIERMEVSGIPVVSANTDGFVSKVPKHLMGIYKAHLLDMQIESSLDLEETIYRSLHSRDVNNYYAITAGGALKTKGAFAPSGPGQSGAAGLKKNPAAEICSEAVGQYLLNCTPIRQTIDACNDVCKFVVVRRVTGGAHMDGEPIGKTVRWYFSTKRNGTLQYIKDNKTVPRSLGAMPLMELPEGNVCPDDIDRDFYEREAWAIVQDIGAGVNDPDLAGKSGHFLGKLAAQKTIHTVDAKTGAALCGRERESIREKWEQFKYVPVGSRHCVKCRKAVEL